MRIQDLEYSADGARMVGQLAVDDTHAKKRPGVLVCHEGPGLTDHTKKIAARLAGLGYAAFAMTTMATASRWPIRAIRASGWRRGAPIRRASALAPMPHWPC